MSELTVVSIDMFQTLVNVNSRCHHIWKRILGENYSVHLGQEYWRLATELIFRNYDKLFSQNKGFVNSKAILEISFAEFFKKVGLKFDPGQAARILVEEHGLSTPYGDTAPFLNFVGEKYPICLVSDADDDMILPLISLFKFDKIFTSERMRAYKNSPGGEMFRAVVRHYGVTPEKILHIGDSIYDILGARRVGIKTCWLNRKEKNWSCNVEPDYTVKSLLEAASLLGVNISNIA
jgi:putative hydrolase of the HAD superfamily